MSNRTVEKIEEELKELYPKKEFAYIDYSENTGDTTGLRERLWDNFSNYQNRWNSLVLERKALLKSNKTLEKK